MVNLSKSIEPKSDQLNADDLIDKSITITVRDVKGFSDAQQPIGIYYEGDNNKPYKPCKSMRRVLVKVWGVDGKNYIGKQMTLYRDDSVMFGGIAVGGIRISHVSDIEKPITMALTANRASRKPYTVKPLQVDKELEALKKRIQSAASKGIEAYETLLSSFNDAEKEKLKSGVAKQFWSECKAQAKKFDENKESEQDIEINNEEKGEENVE